MRGFGGWNDGYDGLGKQPTFRPIENLGCIALHVEDVPLTTGYVRRYFKVIDYCDCGGDPEAEAYADDCGLRNIIDQWYEDMLPITQRRKDA